MSTTFRSRQELRDLRAQQERDARRRKMRLRAGAGAGALVVLAGIGGGITHATRHAHPSSRASVAAGVEVMPAPLSGATTRQTMPQTVKNPTSIPGVLAWNTTGWPGGAEDAGAAPGALEHQHVDGPVSYVVNPPVGGPHSGIWMNAGVYTRPVPSERAVHNMEHGAVWITYRPDLARSEVDKLVALVGRQSLIDESAATHIAGQQSRFMDLSPWASNALPAPIVISAWGHQLRVDRADDPRLQRFITTFRHSSTWTPEYGAGVDGIPTRTGGVAAQYGATRPNPPGKATGGM